MAILDQFGRAYATPPKTIDVSATVGVSNPAHRWESVASTLTPVRAARVVRDARRGNADAYLTLAEEIEERDLHYASVLQTRKLAISGLDFDAEPGDDSARAEEIATEFKRAVLERDFFADAVFDLMDALAKSYSVIQPEWETSESQWTYKALEWQDPRLFVFDPKHLKELRLRGDTDEGAPIPPGQFVVHYPKIKTGIKLRGGLAMLATIAHVAKSYTLADWLAFCEVYGMPLRLAKYDPNTMGQAEINQLKIALANIGHDAAAIIPDGASIEVLDARRPAANGKNVFEGLANYWDSQLSKAVLGQTMTTDDGSSKSQAEVHDDVRLDLRRADARSIRATLSRGIVAPWVYFNYGDNAPLPKLILPVDPPEDLQMFTSAVLPWVERGGLRVKASQIRAKFGLDAPDDELADNEIIGGVSREAVAQRVTPPGVEPQEGTEDV